MITTEHVRAAGGIVHSDGNIFFTDLEKLNAAVTLAQQAEAQPVAWYRKPRPDGGYEGPVFEEDMSQARKNSGDWYPLYTAQPKEKP